MKYERPQGVIARFRSLLHGMFASWIRDGEQQNPKAVYEQAIVERTKQYRELKEAVAGILYMRNKLEAEITERRAEIARVHDDIRRSVRTGRDDASVALIEHKNSLADELSRTERELESVRSEAEEAKANLIRFREEIRGLVREKGRVVATLANAHARRRMQEALDGLSVDAEMKAIESVREHVAKISTEGSLERELGDERLRKRLRSIRDDARTESARTELEELKQELSKRKLAGGKQAPEVVEATGTRAEAFAPAVS